MAKNNTQNILLSVVLLLVGVYIVNLMTGGAIFGTTTPSGDGTGDAGGSGVDIGGLIDGTAEFTGRNMYQPGTSITTGEWARVFNDGFDEGQVSLNSGTVSASPGDDLKIYCMENSSTYYTSVQMMDYPAKERTKIVCDGAQIDTTPTLTFYNDDDTPSTAQAIAASEEKTVTVKIQASADQAFGNPDAEGGNALCVKYNTSEITNAKVTTRADTNMEGLKFATAKSIALPYNISNIQTSTAFGINCYEIDKVADNGWVKYNIEIEASSTDPANDAWAYVDDIAFDLDADTNAEIWGYEDEDNNLLGANARGVTLDLS